MKDSTASTPVETATVEKETTPAPANADGAEKHDASTGNATESPAPGDDDAVVPYDSAEFVSDDGDKLFIGYAWEDHANRDDMLAYVELVECTGRIAGMSLSKWQLQNLHTQIGEMLA
jgi:hypothetical protein